MFCVEASSCFTSASWLEGIHGLWRVNQEMVEGLQLFSVPLVAGEGVKGGRVRQGVNFWIMQI